MKKRYVLKISGEAFAGGNSPLSEENVFKICDQIEKIIATGGKLAIVIGGGNIFRGRNSKNISESEADYIGMQAININSNFLYLCLKARNIKTYLCSALKVDGVINLFDKGIVFEHYNNNEVVIIGGGLGKPGISSDTALIQRAIELEADNILMAKSIDGVYDKVPITSASKKYNEITASDLLEKQQESNKCFMDNEALDLLIKNKFNTYIYKYDDEKSLEMILNEENPGTIIR